MVLKNKRKQRQRIKSIRLKYGKDCFKQWGSRGGNPLIIGLKHRENDTISK